MKNAINNRSSCSKSVLQQNFDMKSVLSKARRSNKVGEGNNQGKDNN